MKTVLVTGGSSGIGAEVVRTFAKEGCNVVFSYNKNKVGAEEVLGDIEGFEGKALYYQAELSREDNARSLVDAALSEFKTIDVLVNNAGGYIDGDEWDGTDKIWSQTLGQNLVSMMNVSKYCIQVFQEQHSGIMINVASRHGLSGQHDALAYAAAKAGVINITQAYAKLLAPHGRANTVSPGAIKTGYWLTAPKEELEEALSGMPMGRLVEIQEVVDVILYLASEKSRMINGQNLIVDGGSALR